MKHIETDSGDWEASMTTECGCVIEFFDDADKLTFDRYCEIERVCNAHAAANPPAEGVKLVLYAATKKPLLTNYVQRCLDGLSPSEVRVRVPSQNHEGSFEEMRVLFYDEALRVLVAAWCIDTEERAHVRALITSEEGPFGSATGKRKLPERIAAVWAAVQAGVAREFPDLCEHAVSCFRAAVAETLARSLRVGDVWANENCKDFRDAAVTCVGLGMIASLGGSEAGSELVAAAAASVIHRKHDYARFLAVQAAQRPKRGLLGFIEQALMARVTGMLMARGVAEKAGGDADEDPFGLFAGQS